jgi:hypothetical protein
MAYPNGCIDDIVAVSAVNGHAKDLASLPQEGTALRSQPLYQHAVISRQNRTDRRRDQQRKQQYRKDLDCLRTHINKHYNPIDIKSSSTTTTTMT